MQVEWILFNYLCVTEKNCHNHIVIEIIGFNGHSFSVKYEPQWPIITRCESCHENRQIISHAMEQFEKV